MKRPNFFIIGAPKCGTTSLADWLSQHPQVYFSPVKEPHYFNTAGEHRKTLDLDTYEALFAQANPAHIAIGEGSVWYFAAEEAVRNIEDYTGGTARYIVCLRNPVDMAHSLHSEMLTNGNEPESNFEKAWMLQDDRATGKALLSYSAAPSHLQYRRSCALGQMLKRLYATVPAVRVKVLFIEDIAHAPEEILSEVACFLGISTDLSSIDLIPKNTAKKPASQGLVRFISMIGAIKRKLNIRLGFGIINRMRRWNTIAAKRPILQPAFRAELVAAFETEVDMLESLTGRNLDHWRQ